MQDSNINNVTAVNSSKKTRLLLAGAVFLIVIALVGAFFAGRQSKTNATAKNAGKPSTSLIAAQLEENKDYWSIVGTVEAVTDKLITVKNNKDKVETATFTSSVAITKKGAGTAGLSEVKAGIKVIVIGKNKDNKITAEKIIIQ